MLGHPTNMDTGNQIVVRVYKVASGSQGGKHAMLTAKKNPNSKNIYKKIIFLGLLGIAINFQTIKHKIVKIYTE